MLQASSTTSVLMTEDIEASRSFNFGFGNSPFQEGARFRLFYVGFYKDLEFYDYESRTSRKVEAKNGVALLVLAPAGGKPEEWDTVTSSTGKTELVPSLKGVFNYTLSKLVTYNKVGYKMVEHSQWKQGDFAKGLCSSADRPDVMDAAMLPRSLEALVENPQFAVPRELFTDLGLTTDLMKAVSFNAVNVNSAGKISIQRKQVGVTLVDYVTYLQNVIKTSTKNVDGHPYIELEYHYTKDQYCEWSHRNLELSKPHAIGYFKQV